jgi:TRAP transporter TAXI family solute receptor
MRRLLLAAIAASTISAGAAQAQQLVLMTGPQGGVWVPLGGQLKNMWEQAMPGVTVMALPGAGIANVRGVEEGKAQLGFGNSISTVDAIAGNPPFETPHENVCNVATLYPQYFQIVVPRNSGIESVADLEGRSISTQPRGNTGELITQQILEANGLSYDDVQTSFVSYTDAVAQVKDGHSDAFALGTTVPSGAVMDLAAGTEIKLLDLSDSIDAMKEMNPGYNLVTVPAGTYPGQEEDVQVIGYATHVVAACDLPEDQVYAMTKAMAENVETMTAVAKAMEGLTPEEMAQDVGVPMHPGAAQYYEEAGVDVQAEVKG